MTLHHFVATISAGPPADGEPITTDKAIKGRYVSLQPGPANTAVIYVGGKNSSGDYILSTTDYGVLLPIPVGGVPSAPYPLDPWGLNAEISLNSIWIKGTVGEKVTVTYWTP